jgi:predicted SAM-dependent methyltransferase
MEACDAGITCTVARGGVRLHVGSGHHRLTGWVNVDILSSAPVDVVADLACGLPFRDAHIDYIHTEDFVEHIDLESGRRFFAEAFRVLRPGGVMRVLTPDLATFARQYVERDDGMLRWYRATFGCGSFAQAFNMGMRMGGHTFLYDGETLAGELAAARFQVEEVAYNQSRHAELRGLDLRSAGTSLYYEATRPPTY